MAKTACIDAARYKGGLSRLTQHNFVNFRFISTKLGDKVFNLLFISNVKFHA